MRDITNKSVEAALLDQKVAGAFRGKTYAYVALVAKRGWILGVAVANESGYHPIEGKTFDNQQQAREWAEGLNAHIGLSDKAAISIVISTMGGVPFRGAK
jgi:hypothetical protein